MTVTTDQLSASVVEHAVIEDVDPASHTVTVRTETTQRTISRVPVSMPYGHPKGAAWFASAKRGAYVWIQYPSDAPDRPFVGGFLPIPHKGAYASGRPAVEAGDMRWEGEEGGFVRLLDGGDVEIGANPLAMRIFRNDGVIEEHANATEITTPSARLRVATATEGEGKDVGEVEVTAYADLEGQDVALTLRLGGGDVAIRLETPTLSLFVSREGSVVLRAPSIAIEGDTWTHTATTREEKGSSESVALSTRTTTLQEDRLAYASSVEEGGSKEILVDRLAVGRGVRRPVVLGGADFLQALQSLYVVQSVAGGPAPVVLVPGPGFALLLSLFSSTLTTT